MGRLARLARGAGGAVCGARQVAVFVFLPNVRDDSRARQQLSPRVPIVDLSLSIMHSLVYRSTKDVVYSETHSPDYPLGHPAPPTTKFISSILPRVNSRAHLSLLQRLLHQLKAEYVLLTATKRYY